jgi:hypothetical protein
VPGWGDVRGFDQEVDSNALALMKRGIASRYPVTAVAGIIETSPVGGLDGASSLRTRISLRPKSSMD